MLTKIYNGAQNKKDVNKILRKEERKQQKIFCGNIEYLIPQKHFLRELENAIDFGFIYDKIKDLYSNTERQSIALVLMIKMLLKGYLYGIDSERKLEQEIKINISCGGF